MSPQTHLREPSVRFARERQVSDSLESERIGHLASEDVTDPVPTPVQENSSKC